MTLIPITTIDGHITALCIGPGSCGQQSTDVTPSPTITTDGVVLEVALTCPNCQQTTRLQRVTPTEAIRVLSDQDMQHARADRDLTMPGDWTVSVAVMWTALDRHGWDSDRRRRHHQTLGRWPL